MIWKAMFEFGIESGEHCPNTFVVSMYPSIYYMVNINKNSGVETNRGAG